MEAGGLEEATCPQDPQTTCSFLLDLVHDDYSPYYSLRCIPKNLDRNATFTAHTLSVNASALPLAQRLQSILPLGV